MFGCQGGEVFLEQCFLAEASTGVGFEGQKPKSSTSRRVEGPKGPCRYMGYTWAVK